MRPASSFTIPHSFLEPADDPDPAPRAACRPACPACCRPGADGTAYDPCRAQWLHPDRALRRGHAAVPSVCSALPGPGEVRALRHHAGGPPDARAGGDRHRRLHRTRCGRARHPGDADAGRHPCRRDRRQGRGLPGAAAAARGRGGRRRTRQAGAVVRPGLQRRWPRAIRRLEPSQPARARADGLAHHGAELQPQPRLPEGRRAGDARDARAAGRVGPAGGRRPACHQRRAVRTRHRHPGRTAAWWRRGPAGDRHAAARRHHCPPGRPGRAAAALLPLVRRARQPGVGHRGRRRAAALLAGLHVGAQPLRDAGRDALLEGLPDPRGVDAQHHRRGRGTGRAARRAVA